MSSKLLKSQSGQTLMELVVVITVAVIVVGALVFATIASLRNAQFAKNQSQATKLAQEGIEKVRVGRDRNQAIINLSPVTFWNGDGNPNSSLWSYQISTGCGTGGNCYFNVDSQGALTYKATSSSVPTTSESIPLAFQRAVILSDSSSSYANQKTVTVIVQWSDFSGTHQSRLTTILGNLGNINP